MTHFLSLSQEAPRPTEEAPPSSAPIPPLPDLFFLFLILFLILLVLVLFLLG